MAAGGRYIIKVQGTLDDTKIKQQLKALEKGTTISFGSASKDAQKTAQGMSDTAKNAQKAAKGVNAYSDGVSKATTKTSKLNDLGRLAFNRVAVSLFDQAVGSAMAAVGDMVSNVFELDAALVEYRKVSDLAGSSLDSFVDKAYEMGKSVAYTGKEMIQSATLFKQSGFSDNQSLQLAKVASMYRNVADEEISAGDAASFIISQMKAFNIPAQNAMHIIDAINEVSNNFAVSSSDIATNIGKASAAMATGNVTYEQSIGLMTAMAEITRNGSTAARGLVSIQSRYNQIADETSSTGKKLTAWYQEHNIAIRDQNGQLRSFYEVGKDVSKIWSQLTDDEKRYYLNTQAGANQSQNLAALMRNYSTAIDATETALNSEGSAAKENAKYMDSLEGALQRLRSAWERFSTQMINSDLVKGGINLLANAIELLSSEGGAFAAKAALIAGGFKLIQKALKGIQATDTVSNLLNLFSGTSGATSKATSGIEAASKAMSGYTVRANRALKKTQTFSKNATKAATTGTKVAGGTNKLGKAFSFLGTNIGMAAAALGVYAGVKVAQKIYKYYQETHRANKATEELTESNKKNVEATEDSISKGQDYLQQLYTLNDVETKTATQKRTMADLVKKLNKLYPELGLAYDSVTDSLNLSSEALDKLIEKQETLTKQKAYRKNARAAKEASDETIDSLNKQKKAIAEYLNALNDQDLTDEQKDIARRDIQKKFKQYINDYKEGAKQWKESIKNYNASYLLSDDWDALKKQYKELGKSIPKSVMDGIKKGKYDAPMTVEEMDELVHFDDIVQRYKEKYGKELPATIQKALSDGLYSMPTSESDLRDIINFDPLRAQIVAMGETVGTEFISAFQNSAPDIRKEFNNLLEEGLEDSPEIMAQIFAAQDWGFDTVLNDLRANAEGNPISLKVELSSADTVENQIDTITQQIGKLEEGQDITIGVKDEATGKIQAITIQAEDFENEYMAGLSADDQASAVIAYTQAVANGYEGTYDAWLGAQVEDAQTKIGETKGDVESLSLPDWLITILGEASSANTKIDTTKAKINTLTANPWTVTVQANTSAASSAIDALKSKLSNLWNKIKGKFATGTRSAPEGFSEVNEEGWEFIRDRKTGQLRVAGGGERTVTYLNKGDIVYPHKESVRMLSDKKNIPIAQHKDGSPTWRQTRQIESWMSNQRRGKQTFDQSWQNLKSYLRQGIIDEDSYVKYIRDASDADIEWRMELYKRNQATYSEMTALIKKHFDSGYMLAEDYYKALEDLADEAKSKEEDRLESLKSQQEDTYDLAKLYVQQQIDLIENENEAQEEQNELLELQNQLTEARNKKVRVYREGVGFVYESDAGAIKEATDALKEYNAEKGNEAKTKQWQDILDLFDQQETLRDIKELENKLGQTTTELFGNMGTNLSAWTEWVKTNLSTTLGLTDILDELGDVDGLKWITEYLNSNMQVDESKILAAINKNKFASGTLNAPGGLSKVGEQGYELAMLGAGDTVLPHTISKNLMEIGKHSAIEWKKMLQNSDGTTMNQYSFGKLVLPNVKNADDFIKELNKLPNQGIQKIASRG